MPESVQRYRHNFVIGSLSNGVCVLFMWRSWQKTNLIVIILMLVLICFWHRCMHSDTLLGNHVLEFIFTWIYCYLNLHVRLYYDTDVFFFGYFNLNLRLYYDTDASFFSRSCLYYLQECWSFGSITSVVTPTCPIYRASLSFLLRASLLFGSKICFALQ
jgi:hypothetical protein